MSEAERYKAEAQEWREKHDLLLAEMDKLRIRQAVERSALTLNVDPDEAYLLADLAGGELTDEGEVNGAEGARRKLVKAKPHLVKQSAAASEIDATRCSGQPPAGQVNKNEL